MAKQKNGAKNLNEKNIFISGKKRVGKSSLMRELYFSLSLDVAGFFTQRIYGKDKDVCAFRLVDFANVDKNKRKTYTLEIHGAQLHAPNFALEYPNTFFRNDANIFDTKRVFDEAGANILKLGIKSKKPMLIIDEIGRLESGSKAHLSALKSALDSPKILLGVLQLGDYELLNSIKNRADCKIFYMDESNVEEVRVDIINHLPPPERI